MIHGWEQHRGAEKAAREKHDVHLLMHVRVVVFRPLGMFPDPRTYVHLHEDFCQVI